MGCGGPGRQGLSPLAEVEGQSLETSGPLLLDLALPESSATRTALGCCPRAAGGDVGPAMRRPRSHLSGVREASRPETTGARRPGYAPCVPLLARLFPQALRPRDRLGRDMLDARPAAVAKLVTGCERHSPTVRWATTVGEPCCSWSDRYLSQGMAITARAQRPRSPSGREGPSQPVPPGCAPYDVGLDCGGLALSNRCRASCQKGGPVQMEITQL